MFNKLDFIGFFNYILDPQRKGFKMEKLKELNENIISYCANKRENNLELYKKHILAIDIFTLSSVLILNYSFLGYFDNDIVTMLPLVTIISVVLFITFRTSITLERIRYSVRKKSGEISREDIEYYSLNLKRIKNKDLFNTFIFSYFSSIMFSFSFSALFHFLLSEYTKKGLTLELFALFLTAILMLLVLVAAATTNSGEKKSKKELLKMRNEIESDLKILADRGNSNDLNNMLLLRKGVKESELKDSVLSEVLDQKLDEELKKNGVLTIEDYLLEKNKELVLLEND